MKIIYNMLIISVFLISSVGRVFASDIPGTVMAELTSKSKVVWENKAKNEKLAIKATIIIPKFNIDYSRIRSLYEKPFFKLENRLSEGYFLIYKVDSSSRVCLYDFKKDIILQLNGVLTAPMGFYDLNRPLTPTMLEETFVGQGLGLGEKAPSHINGYLLLSPKAYTIGEDLKLFYKGEKLFTWDLQKIREFINEFKSINQI